MTGAYRELRVPTTAVEAEILSTDGRTFVGRVFVPDVSALHSGPMRAAEWLNDSALFFPFRPSDGSGSVLLNRNEVLVFTVAAGDDGEGKEIDEAGGVRRRVIVECRDRTFEGDIVIDMPPHLSRVSDYLNGPDRFLIVRGENRHHLIRKARITRVIEPKET